MTANAFSITSILSGEFAFYGSDETSTTPDRYYYIPAYQRQYSWRQNVEIQKLLEDLKYFWKWYSEVENKSYFLGNVIIKRDEGNYGENLERYSVIDGQQRLTTFYLLISALYFKGREANESETSLRKLRKMIEVGENQKLLKFEISKRDMALNNIKHHSISGIELDADGSNYYHNYIYLLDNLINDEMAFDDWINVVDRVRLSLILLGENDDAVSVFESINTGGMILNIADLIKAYLYVVAERYSFDESIFLEINGLYDKLSDTFEVEADENKNWDIASLGTFVISAIQLCEHNAEFIANERNTIYTHFRTLVDDRLRSSNDRFNDLVKLVKEINKYLDKYVELVKTKNIFEKEIVTKEFSRYNIIANRLDGYLTMLITLEIQNSFEKNKIYELLDFHILNTSITSGKQTTKDNKFFIKYLNNNEFKISYETLLNYLRERHSNYHLHSEEEFFKSFNRLNFYGQSFKKITRYLFYRIENHIVIENKTGELIPWNESWSLDHIMPQKNSDWDRSTYNIDYYNENQHNIQNLIMIKKNLNSKIKEDSWIKKKEKLELSGLNLTRELLNITEKSGWMMNDSSIDSPNKKWLDWITKNLKDIFKSEFNILPSRSNNDESLIRYIKSVEKIRALDALKAAFIWKNNISMTYTKVTEIILEMLEYLKEEDLIKDKLTFSIDKIKNDKKYMSERIGRNTINSNFSRLDKDPVFIKDIESRYHIEDDIYNKMIDGL